MKFILPRLTSKQTAVVFFAPLLWWSGWLGALAEVHHLADAQTFSKIQGSQTIFVEAHTSTWKTKGVMFWDVKGSLLTKLAEVGFTVVRDKSEPHELTLTANYDERKGQAFAINRYGTIIEGTFQVGHQTQGPLFEIHIVETSQPSVTGTPPYIDVLHNFLSNPYYHFLGELVRGEVQGSQDPHAIFIASLRADVVEIQNAEEFDPVDSHAARPQHSMPMDKDQYAPVAVRRTLEELVEARDNRLVKILKDMVAYPNVYVQVKSVEAFGEFGVKESVPYLQDLQNQSRHVEVQAAAQKTIDFLTSSSP